MLKKIKHIKPPLLVALSVIIIFCLSCERNDLFTQARVETTDIINPVPGNSGIITAPDINITTNSLMLEWTPAEDNRTAQADLEYRAYRSVTGNINTLFNAQNNGTPVGDWAAGAKNTYVPGLAESTGYYFNVIVRDNAGNMSAYTMFYAMTIDGTPPVVTITAPSDDSTYLDTETQVLIRAEASDNVAVERVEFVINGEILATDSEFPYEYWLPLDGFMPGTEIPVEVFAYDTSGNSSSDSISISITTSP